ncbi:orotate phosphoribosyltransferase [Candidatus Curtissbacteria bacterium]|nr:orotate phosphoribosyltransferase [Candidatus Curtissbacteria bacterium]
MKSIDIDKTAEKVASTLYDISAIIFRPHQPFKYDSGILSPVYTDNRLIISHPKERKLVTKFLVQRIKEIGIPDVVAGTATAGIAHAAFIAAELNIPMVYVRSQPKDHGKGNQVEGLIKRGQRAIIIEDLISTAGSSVKVAKALRKLGAKVTDEVAIFTYRLKASEDNFKKARIKLTCLTDLKHSVETAVKKRFLREDQVQIILDWAKDPQNWGKKMGFE